MRTAIMSAVAVLALVCAGGVFAGMETKASVPEVGKEAPDFTLPAVGGETVQLKELRGKVVVLEWINLGCPWVRKFYGSGKMQEFQAEAAKAGVVWLAICSSAPGEQGYDSIEDWAPVIEQQKIQAASVLVDEDGAVGRLYGATRSPEMFLIDAEGILRYKGAIDDNRDRSPDVIESSRNYVLEGLRLLADGKKLAVTETEPYGCTVKYAKPKK